MFAACCGGGLAHGTHGLHAMGRETCTTHKRTQCRRHSRQPALTPTMECSQAKLLNAAYSAPQTRGLTLAFLSSAASRPFSGSASESMGNFCSRDSNNSN